MPHLSGICNCGRRFHFPKGARLGATWTCRNCGKTWTLSDHGQPLHNTRSKPPRQTAARASGGICSLVLLALLAGAVGLVAVTSSLLAAGPR